MGDTPMWAMKRACALANEQIGRDYWDASDALNRGMGISGDVMLAFAAYIAAHEEEPVDPLEAVIDEMGGHPAIRSTRDIAADFRASLAKRGLKIVEADHAS
jgi:hypothetical protein